MKIKTPLYFCSLCRKVVPTLQSLFFVENSWQKGFCSENCIETFYGPLVSHFENIEKGLRLSLNLQDENCLYYLGESKFTQQALDSPEEIWELGNDLNEKIYSFISCLNDPSGNHFYLLVLCLLFEGKASFVFIMTATRSEKLVNEFRIGKRIESLQPSQKKESLFPKTSELPSEILQETELKKAELLAYLLKERTSKDIPLEDFPHYQEYFHNTIKHPEQIYKSTVQDKYPLITLIRSFQREQVSFYYFVICMELRPSSEFNIKNITPILSFPSIDEKICTHFKKGICLKSAEIN